MSPETLLAACRFAHDVSLMALWGTFAYLATLVPQNLAGLVAARLSAFRLTAAALALTTTLVALPLRAAIIGDGWSAADDRQTLADIVMSTGIGKTWLAQLGLVALLWIAQFLPGGSRPAAVAAAAGLALASLALDGHAVMQDGWQGTVHHGVDALHVLAAGAWVGALVPLALALSRFRGAPLRAEASVALRRFSTIGHWVVALTILSGTANSLFIVGWPLGWSSPYRKLLSAKIVVVLLMTALALLNRYWFVPRLGHRRKSAIMALRTGTFVEIMLGSAAILLVAVFGMLDPDGAD